MNAPVELPTDAEVIADLKKIRTQDWSNPEAFAGLRALYDLLPPEERPARGDAIAVRDALLNLLVGLIAAIETEEEQQPPELDQSIAVAGTHLLKLETPAGAQTQVDDLVGSIVDTWKVRDRHTGEVRPMGIGTFKTGYMDRVVYPALAAHLLATAAARTPSAPLSAAAEDSASLDADPPAAERPPPRRRGPIIIAGVIVLVLAATAAVVALTQRGGDTPADANATPGSRCAQMERQAAEPPSSNTKQPALGGFEMGDFARAASSAGGSYTDPLSAAAGSDVNVKARLSNPGPQAIPSTCVKASVPARSSSHPALKISLISPRANPTTVSDSVSLNVRDERSACLRLVPGTTEFQTASGSTLRNLPDDVLGDGVTVGAVDVSLGDVRFVAFELHLQPRPAGSSCKS